MPRHINEILTEVMSKITGDEMGEIKKEDMPKYKSDIYFDVVIKSKKFMGWSAPDVGMGRMRFIHSDHGEFRVNKGLSANWMRECWEDFMDLVFRLEGANNKDNGE